MATTTRNRRIVLPDAPGWWWAWQDSPPEWVPVRVVVAWADGDGFEITDLVVKSRGGLFSLVDYATVWGGEAVPPEITE